MVDPLRPQECWDSVISSSFAAPMDSEPQMTRSQLQETENDLGQPGERWGSLENAGAMEMAAPMYILPQVFIWGVLYLGGKDDRI